MKLHDEDEWDDDDDEEEMDMSIPDEDIYPNHGDDDWDDEGPGPGDDNSYVHVVPLQENVRTGSGRRPTKEKPWCALPRGYTVMSETKITKETTVSTAMLLLAVAQIEVTLEMLHKTNPELFGPCGVLRGVNNGLEESAKKLKIWADPVLRANYYGLQKPEEPEA